MHGMAASARGEPGAGVEAAKFGAEAGMIGAAILARERPDGIPTLVRLP